MQILSRSHQTARQRTWSSQEVSFVWVCHFGCRHVHLSWQVFAMPMMPPILHHQDWSIENCASSFKIHGFIILICTFWKDRNGETIQVRWLNDLSLTMGWRSIITSHVDPFRCSLNVSFPGPQVPNPPTQVLKCLKRMRFASGLKSTWWRL